MVVVALWIRHLLKRIITSEGTGYFCFSQLELNNLKAAWQKQMQHEVGQTKMSLQELTSRFHSIDKHLQNSKKKSRFWIVIVLIGIGICAFGFAFRRIQYTPEKFPHLNIVLYDVSFMVGILFLILTVVLMYLYGYRYNKIESKFYSENLQVALIGMQKNFYSVERSFLIFCLVLLPPLFYLEINLLSPVIGWRLHQQTASLVGIAILASLFSIGVGFALNRLLFKREMKVLKRLLRDLKEPTL